MRMRRTIVVALCALAGWATALPAQLPRPSSGYLTQKMLRDWAHTGTYSRVITVDSGGKGDYTTISAALTAAAALSPAPDTFDRVTVIVYPGIKQGSSLPSYVETNLDVPAYVSLIGMVPGSASAGIDSGHISVRLTGTTGSLWTVGDRVVLSRMDFTLSLAMTGATTMLAKSSGSGIATLEDVNINVTSAAGDSFALKMISCTSGGLYLERVGIWRFGTATNTVSIFNDGCTAGVSHYLGRIRPGTSQAVAVETTGSVIKMWQSRIDSGATCDLKLAGAASMEAYGVAEYRSVCGSGTVKNAKTYLEALSGAPSGACPPGSAPYDTSYLYLCVGGTWRRIAHEALP